MMLARVRSYLSVPVGWIVTVLPSAKPRRGLLGFLAEGLVAFRAVDAFQADVDLLGSVEDDDGVAVFDTDDLAVNGSAAGARAGNSSNAAKPSDPNSRPYLEHAYHPCQISSPTPCGWMWTRSSRSCPPSFQPISNTPRRWLK